MDPSTIQQLTKLVVKPFNVPQTLASLAAHAAMDRALVMVTQQMTMKIKMVPEEEAVTVAAQEVSEAAAHAAIQPVVAAMVVAAAVVAAAAVAAAEVVEALEAAVSTSTRM